jgi:putative PIN family toxin of toxin-antitoxin system
MTNRAVFDCMIFLQAVANESSPAYACFRLVEEGKVTLFVSAEVLAEVKEVLTRTKLQARFPHLTPERVELFLEKVRATATLIDEVQKSFTYNRDPDDEPYINLAIAARATHLVSRDKGLLDLANDPDFGRLCPWLTVLDPVAFLQEVVRSSQSGAASDENRGNA